MNEHLPIRVAMLLPERVWAGSVLLTQELLLVAGTLRAHSADVQASALFEIDLLGATRAPVPSLAGMALRPTRTLAAAANERYAIVIVPAQFAPAAESTAAERRMAAWLAGQHAGGAVVVSLNGPVLLARSGLLNGRQATGPLSDRQLFARHFPAVRYTPGRRIVVSEGSLICAGGINPTVDVCAHLIERFHGKALARQFLRHTATEAQPSDEHLGVWSAQHKQHGDAAVLAAQQLLEGSLAQPPDLQGLARAVHVSERSLSRRFAAAVGMTLRSYAAECRLEMARLLLRDGSEPLAVVADECGFGSASALVRAFGARHGMPPQRYRESKGLATSSTLQRSLNTPAIQRRRRQQMPQPPYQS